MTSRATSRARDKTIWQRVLVVFALLVLVINGFYPIIWIFLTSIKNELELTTKPITYWPAAASFSNYLEIFRAQPLARYFLNSLIVSSLSTLVCVTFAAFAAYALARLKLRYRRAIAITITAASMFPVVALIIPLFQTMKSLGWLNTYFSLVIPYAAFSLPISTLVLTAFFQGIPEDLESAAMIDGCSRFEALWRIVVPLAAPGVVTAAILAFVNSWNEFLLALTFNSAPDMKTVPVGVTLYQGEFTFPWPLISAAIVVTIIPVIGIIIVFQRKIISGLTAGGVKG
jgi:multiple sugar transport system permease protein